MIPVDKSSIKHKYVIEGDPVPWMRPGVKGRRFYDQQSQLKLIKGINLKNQFGDKGTFTKGLVLTIIFYMAMPTSWGSKKKQSMIGVHHVSRPDFSNMLKFMEDLSVDVRILKDDSLIAEVHGWKVYDLNPRTEFIFQEIE